MKKIPTRHLYLLFGVSYFIILISAVFANFFVIESIKADPINIVLNNNLLIRIGVLALLVTVVFDVVTTWVLYELYQEHTLTKLCCLFRFMHACFMGVAIFSLIAIPSLSEKEAILHAVNQFNNIWLIGLFFFGFHLLLLTLLLPKPKFLIVLLMWAGCAYILDSAMIFSMPNYSDYEWFFMSFLLIPSLLGETSLAIWFLVKRGKTPKEEYPLQC